MPNPAARTAGRIRFAISTPPDEEPDIFHSPLLTFDTIVPAFQRYIRATTLSRPQRKARAPHPGRVRFEGSRMGFPTRSAIRPAGALALGDRGRRLVRLHQSREPLPQS